MSTKFLAHLRYNLKVQAHEDFVSVEVEDLNFVVGDERDARALVGLISKIRADCAGVKKNRVAALFENGLVNVSRDKNSGCILAEAWNNFNRKSRAH